MKAEANLVNFLDGVPFLLESHARSSLSAIKAQHGQAFFSTRDRPRPYRTDHVDARSGEEEVHGAPLLTGPRWRANLPTRAEQDPCSGSLRLGDLHGRSQASEAVQEVDQLLRLAFALLGSVVVVGVVALDLEAAPLGHKFLGIANQLSHVLQTCGPDANAGLAVVSSVARNGVVDGLLEGLKPSGLVVVF